MSLARKAERAILRKSRLKGFVTPEYSGLSIYNAAQTVLKAFGSPSREPLDPGFFDHSLLKGVKNIVLLCVDGLGYGQLRKATVLGKLEGFPVTTVMPSTTATALSTLASGLTPQEHGLVGFRLFLRELGHVTNMLRFGPAMGIGSFADEGIDPEIFFPFPTLYQKLRRRAVKPFIINKYEYISSPLSEMISKGAERIPYIDLPDLFLKAERALKGPGKKYLYLYWDMIDVVSHLYGTGSEELSREMGMLDSQLQGFLEKLPAGTLFLLTADHGLVNSSRRDEVDLGKHRKLVESLGCYPAGEGRLRYLHCKRGKAEKVRAYFESHLSGRGLLLDSREALERGLFGTGKPFPETTHRLGDFVVVPKRNAYFSFPLLDRRESRGKHGGLSKEEMLVPLLWKKA